LYENTAGPTSFSGNGVIGCPALNREGATYADFSVSTATTKVNNAVTGGSPSGDFSYYIVPTTYSNFIELDWRPKSGAAIAGTPSGGTLSSYGIDPSYITTYPAIGLDLAGKARAASGIWARGAYE
jgi:hypothetical protein